MFHTSRSIRVEMQHFHLDVTSMNGRILLLTRLLANHCSRSIAFRDKFEFLIGFCGYPDFQCESQLFNPGDPYAWHEEWSLIQAYVTTQPDLTIPVLAWPCPCRSDKLSQSSHWSSLEEATLIYKKQLLLNK